MNRITEDELQRMERRLAGRRDAFPSNMEITPTALGLSRLQDAEALIMEVRRLQQIVLGYDVSLDFCLRSLEYEGDPMKATREAQENLRREAGIDG